MGGVVAAFVGAADIAAVAVETLADPDDYAGAVYASTGPEALTVAEVAGIIAGVTGRPVGHNDIDRGVWIDSAIAPNDDVRRVTGSPPASFADFAHRNAHAWAVPAAHL